VDIDAHHGNGTEEIIKKCHDPGRLFFFSVHIFDHDKKKSATSTVPTYKFYPGTGEEDDVANNIINVPIAPMWKEKEVSGKSTTPKAASAEPIQTRGRTRRASPSSGGGEKPPPAGGDKSISSDTDSVSLEDSSVNGGSVSSKNGTASAEAARPAHYLLGTGRMAYRRAVQQRLLPSLRAFNPDLILLSSGFDASRGDVGNARHYIGGTQRMGIDLEPEDYAWTTRRVSAM
jgi:acetoin utilization deacetylase AcuC-like enzyme